jgi:integrase/recombinase XerD
MERLELERFPMVGKTEAACKWLSIQANLGLASNTLSAYARCLEDYLRYAEAHDVVVRTAGREDLAQYVRSLIERPSPHGPKIRHLDSAGGLSNATIQQRLTVVRLFYDFLIEEGVRVDNPVGRGRYTPGKGFGGHRGRGLIPRYRKLPWIPSDEQWRQLLESARQEPMRNRLMFAIAYDAGLRREELCSLETAGIDPAHRLIRIRSETTKNRQERIVPYSPGSAALLSAYLVDRRSLSAARSAVSF